MEHDAPEIEPSSIEEPVNFLSHLIQVSDQHAQRSHPDDITYSPYVPAGGGHVPGGSAGVTHSQHEHAEPSADLSIISQSILNGDSKNVSAFDASYPMQMGSVDVPTEFTRTRTGESVLDSNAVWYENGRSYHGYKEGKYLLPNDAAEQDRLDMQHASFRSLLKGRLSLAPVVAPKRVMDVATGTGIWAVEFADENPDSHVIDTDLSAIQPANKPSNCEFIVEDAEEEWVDNVTPFDYVHLRFIATCFDDTTVVLRHAFNNLNPGGWVELQSPDFWVESLDNNLEGTPLLTWFQLVKEGLAARGRDVHVARNYKDWLIQLGFVDVKEKMVKWPANHFSPDPWLKNVGLFQLINFTEGARGIGWKLLEGAGLTAPEIESLTNDAKSTIKNEYYRCYLPTYIVYGRKPFEWEADEWLPDVK